MTHLTSFCLTCPPPPATSHPWHLCWTRGPGWSWWSSHQGCVHKQDVPSAPVWYLPCAIHPTSDKVREVVRRKTNSTGMEQTCVIPVTSTVRRTSHLFCGKWFTSKNTRLPNWVAGCRNICYSLYKCERVCVCKYSRGGTNVYISPFHTQCQGQFFIETFLHRVQNMCGCTYQKEFMPLINKEPSSRINSKSLERSGCRPQKLLLFRSTSISTSGIGFPSGG